MIDEEQKDTDQPAGKGKNLWQRLTLKKDEADGGDDQDDTVDRDEPNPTQRRRWFKSGELSLQLEEYSAELTQARNQLRQTLQALSDNMESQQQTSSDILQSLRPLAGLGEQQAQNMEQVRTLLETMGEGNDQLVASLQAVPNATRDQAEKLAMIEERLQEWNTGTESRQNAMDKLGINLASLCRLSENQQHTLDELKGVSEEQLALARQQFATVKTFGIGVCVVTAVGFIAVVALLAYMMFIR